MVLLYLVLNPRGFNIGFDGLAISGCTLFPHTYMEQVHGGIQIAKYPNYTGDDAYLAASLSSFKYLFAQ